MASLTKMTEGKRKARDAKKLVKRRKKALVNQRKKSKNKK